MKNFTGKDIEDYYDQTEGHYRMFWNLEESLGIHYGIWDDTTKSIAQAVTNTNKKLLELGNIKQTDLVLDAGCGIGGSSIFLAKNIGCKAIGITLSRRQVKSATANAIKHEVDHLVRFEHNTYLSTGYENNLFDVVWAIESLGSSPDKNQFFKEMNRVLKKGGKILIADTFKPTTKSIENNPEMITMLNGWAISDIPSIDELKTMATANDFAVERIDDVSKSIKKSVDVINQISWMGMIGTKLYNLFKNGSYFSRTHYKTGIAQKITYNRNDWGYYLICLKKN